MGRVGAGHELLGGIRHAFFRPAGAPEGSPAAAAAARRTASPRRARWSGHLLAVLPRPAVSANPKPRCRVAVAMARSVSTASTGVARP